MGWEVKIDMSGQSKDCLWVCNVKMKKILSGQKRGTFRGFLGFGAVVLTDLKIFSWDLGYPLVYLLWTHLGQYQLDLDGAHGYIHGPCTTACIWANTAWIFLQPIQTRSRSLLWVFYVN